MAVPHFDLPFRLSGLHAVEVDQDSIEDITNCVEAVIRTFKGARIELPDFGIDDPTFSLQPLAVQDVVQAVLDQEPRASLLISQHPDQFNQTITDVLVRVSTEEVK